MRQRVFRCLFCFLVIQYFGVVTQGRKFTMTLKKFEKMTKTELLVFCLMGVSSGVVIGVGAIASLIANSIFGEWGRLIGACLFAYGIYSIVTYEMRLFTGMVADIPTLGVKNYWKLPVCFICNTLGVFLVALLAYSSPLYENIVSQAQAVIGPKLYAENWQIKAFCSSMICGVLITLSVKAPKYAPQKGLSASVGVIFPILVFAFGGFDHSVANMMYFFYYGEFSWHVIGYILLTIVGNIVGGTGLPTITLLRETAQRHEQERAEKKAAHLNAEKQI